MSDAGAPALVHVIDDDEAVRTLDKILRRLANAAGLA